MTGTTALFDRYTGAMTQIFMFVLPALLTVTCAYPDYQTRIPNGNRVRHPCVEGQAWLGVGHTSPAGGGDRNPFGVDFNKHSLKWTRELCGKDSDGDGRTNGEELGDPSCTWREGHTPTKSQNITHPGICEPPDASHCHHINSWLQCRPGSFHCDAFKDKDLENRTLRLPPTPVPPAVTTYTCMLFKLPSARSYHLVAAQPVLNNTSVVHHMLLFGCRLPVSEGLEESTEPYPCGMVPHSRCMEVIITWTIGIQGDCVHKEAGFRLGKHGYTMVALQVHWNNPDKTSHLMDSSGLEIHFTPNLRPHDAGILVFGHVYLQVDPTSEKDDGKKDFAVPPPYLEKTASLQTYTSTCPQHCLKEMLSNTIYITTAINHMHHLGKHQRLELLRNGTKVQDLAWDQTYDYDSPVPHRLDPPVALHPGDEIRTTCTFRRPPSGQPVCYGDATADEMCFGFLTYFPLQRDLHEPWCTSRRSLISCERTLPKLWDKPIGGCAWRSFIKPPSKEALQFVGSVLGACYVKEELTCSENCRETLGKIRQHPCFVGDIGYYVVDKILAQRGMEGFVRAWFTCNCEDRFDYCERQTEQGVLGENRDRLCAAGLQTGAATSSCLSDRQAALSVLLCLLLLYTIAVFS